MTKKEPSNIANERILEQFNNKVKDILKIKLDQPIVKNDFPNLDNVRSILLTAQNSTSLRNIELIDALIRENKSHTDLVAEIMKPDQSGVDYYKLNIRPFWNSQNGEYYASLFPDDKRLNPVYHKDPLKVFNQFVTSLHLNRTWTLNLIDAIKEGIKGDEQYRSVLDQLIDIYVPRDDIFLALNDAKVDTLAIGLNKPEAVTALNNRYIQSIAKNLKVLEDQDKITLSAIHDGLDASAFDTYIPSVYRLLKLNKDIIDGYTDFARKHNLNNEVSKDALERVNQSKRLLRRMEILKSVPESIFIDAITNFMADSKNTTLPDNAIRLLDFARTFLGGDDGSDKYQAFIERASTGGWLEEYKDISTLGTPSLDDLNNIKHAETINALLNTDTLNPSEEVIGILHRTRDAINARKGVLSEQGI
jgi:hypothetical protein